MEQEKMMHIQCRKGDVGRYVILPGDPGRAEKIAAYLDNAVKVAENREFVTYTGELEGVKVSVCSTGIGGPSAAIAMEELVKCGADTFVRVGTCGGISEEPLPGDIIIATGAVRQEGTTLHYMPIEFPAVADTEVLVELIDAAKTLNMRYHASTTKALVKSISDKMKEYGVAGYMGEFNPLVYNKSAAELMDKWNAWKQAGVLASEMETAALFVAASVLHVRCGAVFLMIWNQERDKAGYQNEMVSDTSGAVQVAVEAVRKMVLKQK